ncbi:calmodulin-dependent protein kinase [Gigaspora margarita]|uniref:Calmodulin-dependent protein kinase n=1 Tax=Gigaspora margarita TaxID=4874 RepID=A0A8H4AXT5_GIGMA|nr:calmodulin-dependent protein kinase [Gigaspora margarita]
MYFYGVCLEKRQHSFVKAESLCYNGWQYIYGNNVEKDESKAFEYYQKGACLWDGESLFWTGFCYANGIAIEKDEQKAFEYYKRSSEVGHKNGIFKTAFCYFYGIGVEKKDGFKWGKKDDFATHTYLDFYSHDCCKKCGYATYQKNDYGIDWCKYCDIDLIVYQWTSGNKTVDDF